MTAASLTPRQIVAELDKHIVGQAAAKRAVAVAVRNRWRRLQLPPDLRADVTPKNLILIGPTGVGKTEIARRLAALVGAPFLKVEATKFTEVGYVGRDVESIVRDLTDAAVALVKKQLKEEVRQAAAERATERLLDLLVPAPAAGFVADADDADRRSRTRDKMRALLAAGELDERTVELKVEARGGPPPMIAGMGINLQQMETDLQQMLERFVPKTTKPRTLPVREARLVLLEQESEALLDPTTVGERAVELAENQGIVFLDEIDKVAGPNGGGGGPDVSRQGVQRDLLPIVEGTTVSTRHGPVRTDHVLFIAAGAFHVSKPSDLMPELQGRFPIRVELTDLTRDDFLRILTEPRHALTRQYAELLKTEGVDLSFTPDGVAAVADLAFELNRTMQNIGARRLHTILERVAEDVSFDGPDLADKRVVIDGPLVRAKIGAITAKEDLSRYIL